jgi:hypothetical protein
MTTQPTELGTNGEPHVLAVVNDYASLHRALRLRKDALDISCGLLDEIAGFTPGHASKLLAPKPMKKLGALTMGLMLQALGVALHMVEDPAALKRVKARFVPREVAIPARSVPWGRSGKQTVVSKRFVKRIAREGGHARAQALSPAQRRSSARQAALIRWRGKEAAVGGAAGQNGSRMADRRMER